MGKITLEQAAQWCGGVVADKYKDITFLGANNDTRKLQAGQLFVALQGVRDGHDFIPAALEKGAAAVLCTHCDGNYPAIVVQDTRIALGDIARQERLRIGMQVVGITGSVGKSTTKEMIATVLQSTYRVSKTPVNHNNDIGMPMSILAMPEDTQIAVLEMGMNHFREIAYLTSIAKPDVAVIINIGTMHIEHLGSKEGILQAKLEILEGMAPGKPIVLNGDDELLWNLHDRQDMNPVYFGVENTQAQVVAKNVAEESGNITYTVALNGEVYPVELPLEGRHFVLDSLAAISVGAQFGVPSEKIRQSLAAFQNMEGRQQIYQAKGFTIIEDCYNAGPESMSAALAVLGNRAGRKIAVLGDMLELGICTSSEHYKVGRIAAEKADLVFSYGPNSTKVQDGALTGGMQPTCVRAFTDADQLAQALRQNALPGDVLLFKGSRGMHMECVLKKFLQNEN